MKITIFYFSGTGNTWYAANKLKDAFIKRGADCRMLSIESDECSDVKSLIENSDKVIIGYPIYGSTAPINMRKFIWNLPATKDKPISIFTTMALYSGDGAILFRKNLKRKGYVYETGMEFIMTNNLNVPGFPDALPIGTHEKVERKNASAAQKADRMAEIILSDKNKVQYDRVFGRMLGALQRRYVDDFIAKLNNTLIVKDDMCIKCMRCVKMCPSDNISFEDGKIAFSDKCFGCMRCYHFCPTCAINITKKSLDTKKWPRYQGPTDDYQKTLL